jgi:hypothetical protein
MPRPRATPAPVEATLAKITLQCVRSHGKLRIRFHSYTNEAGKSFTNVYNNSYNCQFPKDIRSEGRYYEIGPDDIVLVDSGRQPFYRIKKNNIRILTGSGTSSSSTTTPATAAAPAAKPEVVFEVNECVICMENIPDQIFIPCGHLCSCSSCYVQLKKSKPDCPLCRRHIISAIKNTP